MERGQCCLLPTGSSPVFSSLGARKQAAGLRSLPGSSTVSSQDSHMPLQKAWKEKRSSPASQLYCTTSWEDVLALLPSTGSGTSKHSAARPFPHTGLGTFCVPTNQELLSRDVVERPSDSMLRTADRNAHWPEEPFGSSICNRQTQGGETDCRSCLEIWIPSSAAP